MNGAHNLSWFPCFVFLVNVCACRKLHCSTKAYARHVVQCLGLCYVSRCPLHHSIVKCKRSVAGSCSSLKSAKIAGLQPRFSCRFHPLPMFNENSARACHASDSCHFVVCRHHCCQYPHHFQTKCLQGKPRHRVSHDPNTRITRVICMSLCLS